jgi:arabinose-5-phosphate isomerase
LTSKEKIIHRGKTTLLIEAEAIQNLVMQIDENFYKVVDCLNRSKGRIIVTGIGKSGVIGMKIVATMNSTGTPSVFMHAADAIHGDLGIIQKNDSVICISKSGNSPEIKALIPFLKKEKNLLIGMTADTKSFLATNSDLKLITPIKKEACPNNLAPTTSTSVQLAMGDALSMCLLELNEFEAKDFAKYHPGGSLGKMLFQTTKDLIKSQPPPVVDLMDSVKKVITEITSKRLGATAVVDKNKVIGIITDGDIRRMLETYENINKLIASEIMTKNPVKIKHDILATNAIKLMNNKNINHLIVTENSIFIGIINILDFTKEGIS